MRASRRRRSSIAAAGKLLLQALKAPQGAVIAQPRMLAAIVVEGAAEIEDERLGAWDFFYVTSAEKHAPVRFPRGRDAARGDAALKAMPGYLSAYNISDLREIAKRRLPKGVFEFVDRGTEDEVSMRHNRAAFERIRFKPRTLVDVSKRSQEITLFGKQHEMPIAIAPTGSAGLTWYKGEIALARAAAAAGIPFTLATGSMTAMEKVAAEAGGTLWFQLYMWPDRTLSHKLVERARAAGFEGAARHGRQPGAAEPRVQPAQRLHAAVLAHAQERRRRAVASAVAAHACSRAISSRRACRATQNYPTEMKQKITALPMGRSMQ